MEPNYCLFFKGTQILFGLLLGQQKNKWIVQPLNGRDFHAADNQLPLTWRGPVFASPEAGLKELAPLADKAQKQAETIDLETIYQLLVPGEAHSLQELAELFLDHPNQGWDQAALFLAIKADPLKFQHKKDQFIARSQEEIERIVLEEQKRKDAEEKDALEIKWGHELAQGLPPEVLPQHNALWERFKKSILHFTLHPDSSVDKDRLPALLGLDLFQPRVAEHQLLQILSLMGEKKSWGRLLIDRLELSQPWQDATQAEAAILAASNPAENDWDLAMADLSDLTSLTIDNAETKDYDDALSVTLEGDNIRLYVHIAAVGAKVMPQSNLFQAALNRVSSLYTPLAVYPMLPEQLNEETFSLVAGGKKGVLTLECLLTPLGEILESKMYPAVIVVAGNMSYERMDQWLSQGVEPWTALSQFTQALSQVRQAAGALELSRREVKLDFSNPERIQIQYRVDSPASLMVQETAILANAQTADYCVTNQIPCLFRNQAPYEVVTPPPEGEPLQLKDLRILPAKLGLTAEGHAALGLNAYVQATSPIRRFTDLVTQCQVFSHMAGQAIPFSKEDLFSWIIQIDERSKALGQTERKLLDHWKIKYLAQNPEPIYHGKVQRRLRSGKWLVKLVELELPIEMDLVEEKEDILIRLRQVRPEVDYVDAVEAPTELAEDHQDENADPIG